MNYIKLEWPEIQDYMVRDNFSDYSYYDPLKDVWFIPESWDSPIKDLDPIDFNDL